MTPDFRIEAGGRDATAAFADRLVSLVVTDHAGGTADEIEIELDDRDGRCPFPERGVMLRVWMGYKAPGPLPAYMGSFKVNEVTLGGGPRSMMVRGQAADMSGPIRSPRSRSWHDTTIGAIVTAIAKANKLTPAVAPSLASVAIAHIDQTEESDVAFLSRLAAENGAVAKPGDGKLLFVPQGGGTTASGAKAPTLTLTPADVQPDWKATFADRGNFKAVETYWQDTRGGERRAVRVGASSGTGDDESVMRVGHVYATKYSAQRAARARQQRGSAGKVKIEFTAPGRPDIFSGCAITLSGFRPEVDQSFSPKEVTHSIDSGGFTTKVVAEIGGGKESTEGGDNGD